MSRQFDAAVDVALEIGRELRLLTPDRQSKADARRWARVCVRQASLPGRAITQ